VLGETGARDEAVIAYREFPERFPQSPLKDDALFDLGMLYYNNGQYTRAKEVYKEYERLYPDGEYTDRTLYYAGWSARRSGEPTEAILLWEKLIRNYRNSSLRPATLIRTAELYLSRGDYEKSLELYLTFSEDYPEQKEEYGIEKKISETRFLIGGDTREEAELKSIIRNNNRADTRKGREAMIELARLYLFEREGEEQAAYTLLQEVRETAASSDLLAQTAFLLGEFHAVQEQYQQATEWFLQAEEHGAEQKQQASRALYRAAEMQRLLGEKDRVRELVERIQNRYPQTEWAEEARDLLEGLQ
jgi:TolA-binding protein